MKEIIMSVFTLAFISMIARLILPRIQIFVKWLIKIFVHYAEKKVRWSKMGEIKKKKVNRWLKWFGIYSSDFVDELIESAVEIMNSKQSNIKSEISDKVSNQVDETINNITSK